MKATRTLIACVFLLCLHYVAGGHDLSEEYQFSAVLDRDGVYTLHWNFDLQAQTIAFAVNVSTTGWVGFGLSPNGGMIGCDVVIGWVDDNGNVEFHDRYAEGEFLPLIDESQDWLLVSGEEENGYTILKFRRNLTSCDERDMNILADTARVIWSYRSGPDPTNAFDLQIHEKRGSTSLNLLGGLAVDRTEENSHTFSIRNENLTIPSSDTTYWCSVYRLPEEVRGQEHFVYKFAPAISQESLRYVHHIIVFLCDTLDHTHVGASSECINAQVNIGLCRGTGSIIAAWAVGGEEFVYPEGVSYPLGGGKAEYVVLEMHYDNPDMDVGVLDSSGIEFTVTSTPPVHRAGVLSVGHFVANSHIIPPGADNFITTAVCPSECTDLFLPPEGITVFGNILHTHLAGHGLVFRHFRENEECGVLEELESIDENRRYDFNYQQINHLPRKVQIMPGDTLQLECFYRTTHTNSVTLGGESTREEMCVTFFYFYPEIDMNFCLSVPNSEVYMELAQQHFNSTQQVQFFNSLSHPTDTEAAGAILNQIDWTQGAVNSFQQSLLKNNIHSFCASRTNSSINVQKSQPHPTVECLYEAPDTCTGTQPQECCQRLQMDISGASHPAPVLYKISSFLFVLYFIFLMYL